MDITKGWDKMESYKWKVYYHLFPNGKYYIGITSEPTIEDRFKNGNGTLLNQYIKLLKNMVGIILNMDLLPRTLPIIRLIILKNC